MREFKMLRESLQQTTVQFVIFCQEETFLIRKISANFLTNALTNKTKHNKIQQLNTITSIYADN